MAALPIQEAKLSIQQRSVALSRVFYEIEKQTGYSFLVRNNDINMNEKVSIDVKNKSVEEVLEMLFVGKNIRYKVEGEHISAHLQSSVFKLSKDLIDSIHEEGIVAYTS